MTAGSTTRSSSNDPKVVAAIETFGSSPRTTRSLMVARPVLPRPTSATARRVCSPRRRSASCTVRRRFIPSFFPEGTKLGEDADFFYFPPFASKPELGSPVLGAGTLVAITKDSKASRAFHRLPEDAAGA